MNYNNRLPELLAPAGSFEHLKAAVKAGADAVYFGGSRFGARAYAENFTKEKVIEGLDYVHFHDRRTYMTVNTLVKERELQNDLYAYLLPYYEAGLDGVIVQDLGAASFIREHFPGMEVHGSTQMMITSVEGALKAKEMGMNRIVPARELSMEEVARIKKETGLEVEVFIHGALCYCYSGQCLFSSMYGGRSGNRGRCAQPCRLPYRLLDANGKPFMEAPKHLLSPKDLYSLETLPSMIACGVDSLKIEGRMKNVEYVAGVTSIYRKYLDLYKEKYDDVFANDSKRNRSWHVDIKDKNMLEELYSRSGFTEGYWTSHNGQKMMSIETPRHMGRKIGTIQSIRKNQLLIELTDEVVSKDLLVIPGGKEEEVVLTVPSNLESILQKKKKNWMITLNAPKTRWLKPGLSVYRRYNENMQQKIQKEILDQKLEYPVSASMLLGKGQPACLQLESRGDIVAVAGQEPMEAQNRPVNESDLLRQIKKTGNVPFYLEDFAINLEEGLFMQASALKDLRQEAYELLEKEHIRPFRRQEENQAEEEKEAKTGKEEVCFEYKPEVTDEKHGFTENKTKEYIAVVYDDATFQYCLKNTFFHGMVLSMDFYDQEEWIKRKAQIHASGKKAYVSLPRVYRQSTRKIMEELLEKTIEDGEKWDGIYINNINELSLMEEKWSEIPRIYGASLYLWNHKTREEIENLQKKITGQRYWEVPFELSAKELLEYQSASICSNQDPEDQNLECLVYGRFPVMLSAQCLKKTLGYCNGCQEILSMEDRNKRKLPVSSHCHPAWADSALSIENKEVNQACYNLIWKDTPRNLIGEDYSAIAPATKRMRFDFFGINPSQIETVIRDYQSWERRGFTASADKRSEEDHWNIGIE